MYQDTKHRVLVENRKSVQQEWRLKLEWVWPEKRLEELAGSRPWGTSKCLSCRCQSRGRFLSSRVIRSALHIRQVSMASVEDGVMGQRQEAGAGAGDQEGDQPSAHCPGPDLTRLTLIRLAKRRLI